MAEKLSIHCYVSGKVQGVWFRAATKTQAKALGLTGWARNLPDGRVEVMASGDVDKINTLREWLKQGPPSARVDELICEEVPLEIFEMFEIR